MDAVGGAVSGRGERMSKIDCSNIVNFYKEKDRLTKNCKIRCEECPLSRVNNKSKDQYGCCDFINKHAEKAVEILQKWSDENPVKTRLEDFKEKYPKHRIHVTDSMPCVCCMNIGYTDECPIKTCKTCKNCWNMPM